MTGIARSRHGGSRALPVRSAIFFALWLAIAGANAGDLPAGFVAAAAATWISLRLMPPDRSRLRPVALLTLVLRFLAQSVHAGFAVAWLALDPRSRLQPGFVVIRPRLPVGMERDAFCTMASLLPGTLPCGVAGDGGVLVHCLDVTQPVVRQLAHDEALFARAFGCEDADG
jgi:multicomponent Na+:H+ antiporter subunit E